MSDLEEIVVKCGSSKHNSGLNSPTIDVEQEQKKESLSTEEESAEAIIKACDDYSKAINNNGGVFVENEEDSEKKKQEAMDNIEIFNHWYKYGYGYSDLKKRFDGSYLDELYETVVVYFMDDQVVTDAFLEKFKGIIIGMFKDSKKYAGYHDKLSLDSNDSDKFFSLEIKKGVINCLVGVQKIRLCYFKCNGHDYYLS